MGVARVEFLQTCTSVKAHMNPSIEFLLTRNRDIGQRLLGTLSLVAILLIVFQVEILASTALGYASVRELFAAPSILTKKFIAVVLGPFLHRGDSHLIGNLGVLLILGAYLEWTHGRKVIYAFYLSIGYVAAWVPVLLGSVGALGASGVTYGLGGLALVFGSYRGLKLAYRGLPTRAIAHLLVAMYGFVSVCSALSQLLLDGVANAGVVTHAFGAFLGAIFAVKILSERIGFPDV